MSPSPILRVAVPVPLRRSYDYLPPEGVDAHAIRPGERILVPFGPRQRLGIVLEVVETSDVDQSRLRRAIRCPDDAPVLPADILTLVQWAAGYYHAAIGEAVLGSIPVGLRGLSARRPRAERRWAAHPDAGGLGDGALQRAPAQAAVLAHLRQHGPISEAERRQLDIRLDLLRALQEKGLVIELSSDTEGKTSGDQTHAIVCRHSPLSLNAEQQQALSAVQDRLGEFVCHLLEGVTGSGKTEVYLQLIATLLERGKQALVLVPEIGLTPQTQRRFSERFGDVVTVLHSGLTDSERLNRWQAAAAGDARVIIGTRSAVFTPLPELGIVIIDEEHDLSFKQQDGFRYSARDVAIYRARQCDIPVVLGSATPSTESLVNVQAGRYQHLPLTQRAGNARPPEIALVDIRGQTLEGGLSNTLIDAISAALSRGEQTLVFINRRGWAPVLCCPDCGWMAECGQCDARMTLHKSDRRLWCHHCDSRRAVPSCCPGCKSNRLAALGAGTERCEHVLQRHFPRFPIRRIDRGSMQARDAMELVMDEVNRGEPCILVGTQMLAKGHHFANVTLVAILDIDAGLFSADFRAPERTAQLLVQVAGRSGRGDRPGRVMIQTMNPEHVWLQRLSLQGYSAFIEPLLEERRLRQAPPYCVLALIRVESPEEQECIRTLKKLRDALTAQPEPVELIGPLPATMQRRAGRHRFQMLLKASSRPALHAALRRGTAELENSRLSRLARWHIDVDPQADF